MSANSTHLTGIERIAAERQRQIDAEGWTPEHDDEHDACQLADAARSYIGHAIWQWWNERHGGWRTQPDPPKAWPWEREWWKASDDPIRNLEKAGALIAAEIDRLQRQRASAQEAEHRA